MTRHDRHDPSLLVVLYEQNESAPVDRSIACALDALTAMHYLPPCSSLLVCVCETAEDQAAAALSHPLCLETLLLLVTTTTITRQDEQISRSSSSEYVSDGEHSNGIAEKDALSISC